MGQYNAGVVRRLFLWVYIGNRSLASPTIWIFTGLRMFLNLNFIIEDQGFRA